MKNKLITLPILISIFFFSSISAQKSELVYLSGKGIDDAVDWEFYCTKGQNSGFWTTLPVPSNWELHGFGTYNYGHDKVKGDEQGLYRLQFHAPLEWKNKNVTIVFVASMTDTEVKINGQMAGPMHQGGFYQFEYDISDKLKFGKENLLEVSVSKMSANESVNMAERKADYWIFGGIFRPVYLKISPEDHIKRIAIDAKANGSLKVETYIHSSLKNAILQAFITDLSGNTIGKTFSIEVYQGEEKAVLSEELNDIKPWNPEFPNLYMVHLQLIHKGKVIHEHKERFGFRTVEVKLRDGIYVNGEKIMFRGVCRHSFWPSSGRALSKELSIKDVELMKDMNINAVRMSHYPPDPHFLDVCDSLGLFVLDELAGWQRPPYDTEIGKKLVKELVTRDVNHPSIILWDNGNEGGWNNELNDEFSKYDPQNRTVIHPWELFNGLDTKHYREWNYGAGTFFNGRDIFFPTEFLHGLYDGGHGAGLEDFWNLMLDRPLSAGGFLWVFSDEGVVRTDKDGWIDTQKSNAPDGIVGPYREKEGSFYSIKEIWSPVHINMEFIPPGWSGQIEVENRFFYTDIEDCKFTSTIYQFNSSGLISIEKPEVKVPSILPKNKGNIAILLPDDYKTAADVFELKATDPHGRAIMTWTWPLKTPEEFNKDLRPGASELSTELEETTDQFLLRSAKTSVYISKSSGIIDSVTLNGKNTGFGKGPVLTHSSMKLNEIKNIPENAQKYVVASFTDDAYKIKYSIESDGWIRIEYQYYLKGKFDFAGINFNYPEDKLQKVNMIADGPYRVYKNRMKGPQFGYWEKTYNNTVTGESWNYPEFKGYYSNFYRAEFISDEFPFSVFTENEDIFLRLYTPGNPEGAYNTNTDPLFPDGDISFLDVISPIGTKFKTAEQIGPMGFKNDLNKWQDDKPNTKVLYFNFEK